MTAEWRPNDWINSQEQFIKINVGATKAYFKNGSKKYEDGASAMLAAIIKYLDGANDLKDLDKRLQELKGKAL